MKKAIHAILFEQKCRFLCKTAPFFLFSALCIVVFSLITKKPSKEIEEDFEAVRKGNVKA